MYVHTISFQFSTLSNHYSFLVGALLFPEPTYSGPDKVIYFRGVQGLDEELARDKKTTWVVAFYTVWNPACVTFAPIFANLSNKLHLDNLKFGKVDIGRYPDAGQKYHVSDSSLSKQLPTIIVFQDGKEVNRRPTVDSKGKLIKFTFTEDNVLSGFGLRGIYENCRNQVKSKPHND